ncbi:hypothetical protein [Helicobacter pylori]|uniref:hypothetical protein n=1 Tax=Helicobacter pylori TaxID=210 RepID=UPI001C62EEE4|nr:hypothetical protein [Helicobacter pylori]
MKKSRSKYQQPKPKNKKKSRFKERKTQSFKTKQQEVLLSDNTLWLLTSER